MGCDVGQYLPIDDSPVVAVERIVHLSKVAFPTRPRARRGFAPTNKIELLVDTPEGSLDLVAYGDRKGDFFAELHDGNVKLRSLHTHYGHRNPGAPEGTRLENGHMHFPSERYPLITSGYEYGYPIELPKFDYPYDILLFFCDDLDIQIDRMQLQLALGGRR